MRAVLVFFGLLATVALLPAEILFQSSFENGTVVSTDTNWSSNSHGLVVTDPLNSGNHVLEFTGTQGGGDLFSKVIAITGVTYIAFDYLSTAGTNGGGFIGISGNSSGEVWLAGNCPSCYSGGNYTSALTGIPAGSWQHVMLTVSQFGNTSYRLELEQFVGTAPSAYFDNIVVSTTPISAAPEPGTAARLVGALGLAFAIRKR